MKIVFCIVLSSIISLPVSAGNEFWAWQEKHKQQLEAGSLEINQQDAVYIEALSAKWVSKKLNYSQYIPFKSDRSLPVKKSVKAEQFESAKAQALSAPVVEILETPHLLNDRISFDFYQHQFEIKDSAKWSLSDAVQSSDDVALGWAYFSTLPSSGLLQQFKMLKQELNLNDWDFAVMVYQYSAIWQKEQNAQLLQTQFILVKSGLKTKLGFSEKQLHLLMQTQQTVLNESYYLDEKRRRWYILDLNNNIEQLSNLEITSALHANEREPFTLLMNPKLNLGGQWQNKLLNYQIENVQYDIYLPFQGELIEHYKNYPILSLDNYVNHEIHEFVYTAIYDQIKTKIDVNNEQQTLNFLLNFVQTLIKSDEGRQAAPMIIQQSIFESHGTAVERVLLFINLVEAILDNYMMVVQYENHLSTGVKLKSDNNLKSFHVNLNDYVFADPSFKGAKLGDRMPLKNNPFKKWLPLY